MANITFPRKKFEQELGKKITPQLEEKIALFGTPLEKLTETQVELEIFPNRPDMLSMHGFLRSFKTFLGIQTGIKKYKLNKPEKNFSVKINPNLKGIRPATACAIIKGLNLDDQKIKEIIDLQEKLHGTIGRNRKKVAIGIYPLEKIKLPIRFEARSPKDIKFIPLEENRELNGQQILAKHPAGKEYAHLLQDYNKYPIFIDADNNILSMPPVINSHNTGKVAQNTKEVFVECSGAHVPTLKKTLNIIVTTLADMGGKIYQMTLEYPNHQEVTPSLEPEKKKISLENTNKLIGLNLKEKDLEKLLAKMGIDYKNKTAIIPAWRADILHEVDLIEDVAIAYGYDNLKPTIPNIATIAQESTKSKLTKKIAETLTGLGFLEVSSYHLIKEAEYPKQERAIKLENSKTEYKLLRPDLLIPALRIISENKDQEYPQKIFEIGTVFAKGASETGIKEKTNLLVFASPANATNLKQIIDTLANAFKLNYQLEPSTHPMLIDGRTAIIKLNTKPIGYMGELHPETLRKWNIKMPCAALELNLKEIFKSIS